MLRKMDTWKSSAVVLGIILLSFIVSVYVYPVMPEEMASHWNAKGEADGYMQKLWGLFLTPFILAGLALFFFIIPKIDPLKENIKEFRGYYDAFIVLFSVFMFPSTCR